MSLTDAHRRMLLEESAISEAIVEARGYRSLTAAEAADALPILGFSAHQAKTLGAGLLLRLTLPDDLAPLWQYRPDHPTPNAEGKIRKYVCPYDKGNRLIFHPAAMEALATGHGPIYVTEGAKKLDALLSQGATALGVIGVESFAVTRTDTEKAHHVPRVLLPDWGKVALAGREVRIVYDSDAVTKADVGRAERDLSCLLRAAGARVRLVRLPPRRNGSKQGVDDFFASGGTLADLDALLHLPAGEHPRKQFSLIAARDLHRKQFPPQQMIVPDILAVGATLFTARGKDGKSLAMWNLCLAIQTGGMVFGRYPATQGDVLYLALEDGERRAQERLDDQMLHMDMEDLPTDVAFDLVLWEAPTVGEGLEEEITAWLDAHPHARLVVIDILEKIRPRRTHNGSVYGDDYAAIAPLQRLAQERGIALVIVHHSNKSKPEDFRDTASANLAMTSVTPVCTLADLILYVATRTALIAARRRT